MSNILVNGSPQTRVYDVVVMDPDTVSTEIFDDGFEDGSTSKWVRR